MTTQLTDGSTKIITEKTITQAPEKAPTTIPIRALTKVSTKANSTDILKP